MPYIQILLNPIVHFGGKAKEYSQINRTLTFTLEFTQISKKENIELK